MKKNYYIAIALVGLALIAIGFFYSPKSELANETQENKMTFFVTSSNPGSGADFGGLGGADNYCQILAESVGSDNRIWRAYLSTVDTAEAQTVDARDRIGNGPWQNAKGVIIAENVEQLHSNNNLTKETALTEKGEVVNGRGDTPNIHDILTGSTPEGRAFATTTDSTCGNWTKNTPDGSAVVGHHDRIGLRDDDSSRSWNSSHFSRGCNLEGLASTGSGGLIYCFAIN